MLRREAEEGPHAGIPIPTPQEAANIADQIQELAGGEAQAQGGKFTATNYDDRVLLPAALLRARDARRRCKGLSKQ